MLPVSELLLDGEAGVGEEGGERAAVEEAEGASADLGLIPAGAGEGMGEGDEVAADRGLDLVGHADGPAVVDDLDGVLGGPAFPGSGERVSGLEGEAAVVAEEGANSCERVAELVVVDEYLEGVTGHDDEVELLVAVDGGQVAKGPVDVGLLPPGQVEHGGGGVEAAESSVVAGLAGGMQELAGAATDVEDAVGGHEEGQVEVEVASVEGEGVVEVGKGGVGEDGVNGHCT